MEESRDTAIQSVTLSTGLGVPIKINCSTHVEIILSCDLIKMVEFMTVKCAVDEAIDGGKTEADSRSIGRTSST